VAGPESHIFKDISRIIGIAGLYFLLARIGQCLAVEPGNVTPIWPASGFAFVVALRRTRYGWIGLWLGNFLANTWAFLDLSTAGDALRTIVTGLAIGPADVLQAYGGAWLFRRCEPSGSRLDSIRAVYCFVASQSVACLASASFGVLALCTGQIIGWEDFSYTWLTWYLGDAVGIITFAPVLLTWRIAPGLFKNTSESVELLLMVVLGLLLSLLVFTDVSDVSLFALPIGVLLWAAVRGNQFIVAITGLAISAAAIYGTSNGNGPFQSSDINVSLLSLQLYMAVTVVSGQSVSAALSERTRSAAKLGIEKQRRREGDLELELAVQIQKEFLPKISPDFEGFELAARCIPSVGAAGDFYDMFLMDDGQLAIVVGDVAGHGVGPALITSSARSRIRSLKDYHSNAAELLDAVNRGLCEDTGRSRFITLFLAICDPLTGIVNWSSAGHTALFISPDGEVTELPNCGLPLGVVDDAEFDQGKSVQLVPGATLVVLTDGFSESHNENREMFGERQVAETLVKLRHRSPDEIADELINDVYQFCGSTRPVDDLTIVIARILIE
jgi:serine phosphatase RsbU (regulator of sigma subunit)/integral membrane sensor domain MASE1